MVVGGYEVGAGGGVELKSAPFCAAFSSSGLQGFCLTITSCARPPRAYCTARDGEGEDGGRRRERRARVFHSPCSSCTHFLYGNSCQNAAGLQRTAELRLVLGPWHRRGSREGRSALGKFSGPAPFQSPQGEEPRGGGITRRDSALIRVILRHV